MMNQGIMSGPMSYYFTEQQPRAGLFLGFSCSPVEKIPPAVQQMARVLGG
jgi:DNA-binding transcriptional MocR family regulator